MPSQRSFPHGRYVVYFLPRSSGIEIVRVLHSARDTTFEDFGSEGNG